MDITKDNILNNLKHFAFVVVVFSLLLQPIYQAIAVFNNDDIELVAIDWEDDASDEEDKQEDDTIEDEERTEPQLLNSQRHAFFNIATISNYDVFEFVLDFNLEILIPPPKFS